MEWEMARDKVTNVPQGCQQRALSFWAWVGLLLGCPFRNSTQAPVPQGLGVALASLHWLDPAVIPISGHSPCEVASCYG